MKVEECIKNLIADTSAGGKGYANACQLWRGFGDMGQRPYGWWLKPFGETARFIGRSWKEIKADW